VSNIESAGGNDEVWNHCAQSYLKNNNDRIPYFEIRNSLFDTYSPPEDSHLNKTSRMKLHEFRCYFLEVGRASVPANPSRHGGRPYDSTRLKFPFRFDRPFFWPAAGLNPEPLNLEPLNFEPWPHPSQNTVFIDQKYMIHPIFYLRAIKYEYSIGVICERWGTLAAQVPYLQSINKIVHLF